MLLHLVSSSPGSEVPVVGCHVGSSTQQNLCKQERLLRASCFGSGSICLPSVTSTVLKLDILLLPAWG